MQGKKLGILALLAVLATVGLLWLSNRTVLQKEPTWDDILAEAKAGGYRIITTDELSERYRRESANLFLVDTRQEWEYRTGHIPEAVNFPIEPTAWSRWRKASALERLLGPDKNRTVIFY